MASQHISTNIQQEVTCPICLDILQDPVTIDCGHSFCHFCITQLKEVSRYHIKCPLCKSSTRDMYTPNWLLRALVERILVMDPSEIQPKEEELKCPKHGEKLHYFCEEDGELLCDVCRDSKDHKLHKSNLIEEAAQHHQEQIQLHLGVLRQKEQELVNMKAEVDKKISNFMAQVDVEKQRIHTEFKHLQQVLEENKNFLLSNIEQQAQHEVKECERYNVDTQKQLSSLKDIMDSLKAKQQMPPRQLLQDIKGTLHRSEEFQVQFHSKTPIPLDLDQQLNEAKSRHDTMIESLRKYGEKLQADRKKHQGKTLQDMSATHRQRGDRTANPKSSTLHTPAQFQPKINSDRPELSLQLSRASLAWVPRNTGITDTWDIRSLHHPMSAAELLRVLTPVIFDVGSAHPSLSLSADLKTVTADVIARNHLVFPVEPRRFFPSRCVLGLPGFSTGCHTWVVELSGPGGGSCIVGVAWEQVPRRGLMLEPAKGFWVLKITNSVCEAITGRDSWENLPVCPRRVGVRVNLEGKEVTFYDAATKDHMYTFHTSFPGKIFPFFKLLSSGTQLSLSP